VLLVNIPGERVVFFRPACNIEQQGVTKDSLGVCIEDRKLGPFSHEAAFDITNFEVLQRQHVLLIFFLERQELGSPHDGRDEPLRSRTSESVNQERLSVDSTKK
jgi:hypothetical protein